MPSATMCSGRVISRMPVIPMSSVVVTVDARSRRARARWVRPPITDAMNGSPSVPAGGSAGSRVMAQMLSTAATAMTRTAASTDTVAAIVAAVAGPVIVAAPKLAASREFARANRA